MKKLSFFTVIVFLGLPGYAQLVITAGGQWANTGNVMLCLQDADLINNGTFTAGNSVVRFSGSASNNINSSSAIAFYELELAKTGTNKINLLSDIDIANKVTFISGLLELNGNDIDLAGTAFLNNENETSRITALSGGQVVITVSMNAPSDLNAGNLGAIITDAGNLGTVTIKRGHKDQNGTGLTGSIDRYFDILPSNNTGLSGTLRFRYFDAELNVQNENTMLMFKSDDNGTNWNNVGFNDRDAVANYVERTGIASFSRWTLSSNAGALPVTGLQFYAQRISHDIVRLDWKTIQEINNQGFTIERKKENENVFIPVAVVLSAAPGGNSYFPLNYSKNDNNAFSGKTFYRLKQTDIDGHITYSETRVVNGDALNVISLKAWPVPSSIRFTVKVEGIDRDVLLIHDMAGRLIRQVSISNGLEQKIYGLTQGTYILSLAGHKDVRQKMIVQ